MQRAINPGLMDWAITFYSPTTTRDSIGDDVESQGSVAGSYRAQKVDDDSTEKQEAGQQVGNRTLTFRVRDFRKSFVPDYTWEFDAYPISNVNLTTRYKVLRIRDEGRGNYILITGEARDHG